MNHNVSRLLAEKDLRMLGVQNARHGGEVFTHVRQSLVIEYGDPWKIGTAQEKDSPPTAERDKEGFEELRALAAMM